MGVDKISYEDNGHVYVEYNTGKVFRLEYENSNSERVENAYSFSLEEIDWMKSILKKPNRQGSFRISQSYIENIKIRQSRVRNKEKNKKILKNIQEKLPFFSLEELKKISTMTDNKKENYSVEGIYLLFNKVSESYYIGKSKNILKRSKLHFKANSGNPEVYSDYSKGDEFQITLIPLAKTPYKTLNELEYIAIMVYESFHYGYNRNQGNINDRPFFENIDYEKVGYFILNRVKHTNFFSTITNNKKRLLYIHAIFSEYDLPNDYHFIQEFKKMIKNYQRDLR